MNVTLAASVSIHHPVHGILLYLTFHLSRIAFWKTFCVLEIVSEHSQRLPVFSQREHETAGRLSVSLSPNTGRLSPGYLRETPPIMSIFDLPPSPPSTSSRRKLHPPNPRVDFLSTPDSPASFPASSSTTRKRVEFSPWTNALDPHGSSQPPSSASAVKPLLPSSECQALKSILKPTASEDIPVTSNAQLRQVDLSVGEMIESIIQELSCDERTVSVDAYQTLWRVIRQYDGIPEEAVLKVKVTAILRYIKRDILRPMLEIADTNLITQALKILVILVWNPDFSVFLTDEYRSFVLDRSILVISEHTAPKSVIMHYLHLLATQEFRPNLITYNNRATRLLEALKVLSDHIKGNGILSERLLLYRKLLDQTKATMKTKAHLWVEELLSGMTHHMKDVRTKAVELGLQACSAFPTSSSISGSVRNALSNELDNGMTMGTAMSRRLEKMIATKDDMIQVPQIWAIVVLLSSSVDTKVDDWADLKDWLKVIQRCFNCSELAVRQQSNIAWNRFVSVVRPHEASDTLLSMLAKPIAAQLEKQATGNMVKSSRAAAVSSYCNLLYYAFRPAATHKQYTRVWNEYIVKLMRSSFFEKNIANADISCRVLMAILWNSSKGAKVWNESRALQDSRPIAPEELPTIDSKWVRMRSSAIVDMFGVLLKYCSWGASGQSDKAYIAVAWTHFLRAQREASSKEIKPTMETKQATLTVIQFLSKLWEDAEMDFLNDKAQSLAQIRQMTRSTILELGPLLVLTALEASPSGSLVFMYMELFNHLTSEMCSCEESNDHQTAITGQRASSQILTSSYERWIDSLAIFVSDHTKGQYSTAFPKHMLEIPVLLCEVLRRTPEDYLVHILTKLQDSIIVILGWPTGIMAPGDIDSLPDENLPWEVVNALTRIPVEEVHPFDDVFAAVFNCEDQRRNHHAIQICNAKFRPEDEGALGPKLRLALTQFQSLSSTEGLERDVRELSRESNAVPHGEQEEARFTTDMDSFGIQSPILGSQGQLTMDMSPGPHDHGDNLETSLATSKHNPRVRHDDSQVHFMPIVSSSPPNEDPESQFLTARQKDVRERQRSEPAVVFPDLRSSPKIHNRSQSYNDCEFARKVADLSERPSTPTLPTHHEQNEVEIMESPTPRARHFTTGILDVEVPSSPPSLPDNQDDVMNALEIISSPSHVASDGAQGGIQIGIPQSDPPEAALAETSNAVEGNQEFDTPFRATSPVHLEQDTARNDVSTNDVSMWEDTPGQFFTAPEEDRLEISRYSNPDMMSGAVPEDDTDEIDMLSASQLSQDLDLHLSRKVTVPIVSVSTRDIPAENEHVDPEARAESRSYNIRKRKAQDYAGPVKRRRGRRSSQRSSNFQGSTSSASQPGSQQEMLDCIEIFTSVRVEAEAEPTTREPVQEPLVMPSVMPKRRRGRPRKYPRPAEVQSLEAPTAPLRTTSDSPTLMVKVETSEPSIADACGDASPEETREARRAGSKSDSVSTKDASVDVMDNQERDASLLPQTTSMEAAPSTNEHENVNHIEPATLDFMNTLQQALDQLKSTSPGANIDLRKVDDLCFQIRFQAQVLSQPAVGQ